MALTNNTDYRKKTITITKKVNGSMVTTGGFPITVSILSAFGAFPAIDVDAIRTMTSTDYNTRLNGFYDYLELTYPFWTRGTVLNNAFGTDAITCPLDNTPPSLPAVTEFGSSIQTSGSDVLVTWFVQLAEISTQDVNFQMTVLITDAQGIVVKGEFVVGIIPAETLRYDNPSPLLIPEANGLVGCVTSIAPGSFQITF